MAATLVSFVSLRLMFVHWMRPHLISPLVRTVALTAGGMGFGSRNGGAMTLMPDPPPMPNAWLYSTRVVDRAGRDLPTSVVSKVCPTLGAGALPPDGGAGGGVARGPAPKGIVDDLHTCVVKLSAGYHELITYQPAHRYWPLQWIEVAAYLGAALAVAGFCFWWVRRRLA